MNTSVDLNSCDREPIHIPGSIQPHGLMLVVDQASFQVRQVAGAVETRLGVVAWQNQNLAVLIGDDLASEVRRLLAPEAIGGFIGQLRSPSGETFDVSAHLATPSIIVELETASAAALPGASLLEDLTGSMGGFERSVSLEALCEKAAVEFRRFTGFDRVMIYRFLDDGVGCVVAEAKSDAIASFLHHHFPATDIPLQARALYIRNLIRVIPDISYQPVALRPADGAALDMSDSSLRSVSPIHLSYLRNMGVRASASVSIVKDGALWGLVACHNLTPRSLSYDVRAACRSLAGSLARHIKAKEEAEGYRQRIRLRSFEDDIVALLARGSLHEVLCSHLQELGRMMGADGLAVVRGDDLVTFGFAPEGAAIRSLADWLLATSTEPVFRTDNLSSLYPPAAEFQQHGSGVMAITLAADARWILFLFRAEQLETVNWAGNPHKGGTFDPEEILTPRASFAAWREIVGGRSARWTMAEVDAALRLRAALLNIQQNQQMHELNRQLTRTLQDKDSLLQQKEFLIGEVNHRVQNSLQLVSSYLALQARASATPDLKIALEEARKRLNAVALVHRRLYRGEQLGVVDMARYIEELCADTFSFKGLDWAEHLTLVLSPVRVSTDHAITLGLVLTELMINANKHAYAGNEGPIEVVLTEDRTHLQLVVADKGRGKVSGPGFGSRMVEGLVAQIGGELAYLDNQPGLRTTLRVPVQIVAPV